MRSPAIIHGVIIFRFKAVRYLLPFQHSQEINLGNCPREGVFWSERWDLNPRAAGSKPAEINQTPLLSVGGPAGIRTRVRRRSH